MCWDKCCCLSAKECLPYPLKVSFIWEVFEKGGKSTPLPNLGKILATVWSYKTEIAASAFPCYKACWHICVTAKASQSFVSPKKRQVPALSECLLAKIGFACCRCLDQTYFWCWGRKAHKAVGPFGDSCQQHVVLARQTQPALLCFGGRKSSLSDPISWRFS